MNIEKLAEVIINHNNTIDYWKMCEIAEKAISYLEDNDMLEDMLDDQGLELDEEEREYFGLTDDDYDEEE